jgi:chromosome segregation ATPase
VFVGISMRRELESRRVEFASRDSELEALKELQKQNAELIESLRAAELLSAQRASEIDRLKAKVESDASDAGRELISVRSHLSECKFQLAELQQQLDARQQSEATVAQNMRQTHTEIDMLTQRFVAEREQWQSTNERLALDLDAARTAWQEEKNINSELHSAISELQSSVQRRNQDFAALHKTIEEIKQERAASGDAQAQLSKALVANAATEQELSAQRLHVTALDEALKVFSSFYHTLLQCFAVFQLIDCFSLQTTRAELEQSKARARSLESAAAEGIEAKKTLEKAEADAAAARRLNDRLQRDLEDLTTVSTRFQREQARAAQVALAAQGHAAQVCFLCS